jgi:inosine/xanthosine triphosphate pyrophosphatase family protein
MDILIGTKNQFKSKEMLWHLEGLDNLVVHTLDELEQSFNIEEDGATLLANAEKKAIEISMHTDWLVFTSDAGVDIPGLGKKWDLRRPKRTVGENKSERARIDTLLKMMEGLKGEDRRCQYYVALALAQNGKLNWSQQVPGESGLMVTHDETEELLPDSWMAVVWYYPDLKKTDYQLSQEERTQIRHKYQSGLKKELQDQIKLLYS